jgi:DNA-binding NarL/FixJ family response regulator
VVLADDHRLVRDGLRSLLAASGVDVVGEAGDGLEAITVAKRTAPSAVVMDIAMPHLNGIDTTRRLVAEIRGLKVVALTMNADRRYVLAMLEAGATGYVLKNSATEELLAALEAVARGETYLSPAIAASVVDQAIHGPTSHPRPEKALTGREREVLQLIAEGKATKEIAQLLEIGVATVETHRRQIAEKLGLRTIAELTKYAIREGLTSLG